MAQPENFINQFADRVAEATPAIDEKRAVDEQRLTDQERAVLDEMELKEAEKKTALQSRSDTLDIAWITSGLAAMSETVMNENPPHVWYDTPVQADQTPKLIERRQPLTPEKKMLLEGWPILSWTHKDFDFNPKYTLVLTPPTDENSGNNLVWITEYKKDYTSQVPFEKADIHPFTDDPVSQGDMPWPKHWPAHKAGETLKESQIADNHEVRGKHQEVFIMGGNNSDNPDYKTDQDYETYNKAGIEELINDALVKFAAENNLFASKEEMQAMLEARNAALRPVQPVQPEIVEPHWGDDPFAMMEYPDPSEMGIDTELQPDVVTEPETEPMTTENIHEDMESVVDAFIKDEAYGITEPLPKGGELAITHWQGLTHEEAAQLEALGYEGARSVQIKRLKTKEFNHPVEAFDVSIRLTAADELGTTLIHGVMEPDNYFDSAPTDDEIRMMYGEDNTERGDTLFVRKDSKTAQITRELIRRLKSIAPK